MNVITLESAVFNSIMAKLDKLETEFTKTVRSASYPLSERWLDNDIACKIFNCSKRTLQMYRDEQHLPFSQIKHRMYYRAIDIEKFLNENLKTKGETAKRRVSKSRKTNNLLP